MTYQKAVILVFACSIFAGIVKGNLHSALHDYELLDHTSFRHHIRKRDLYSRDPDVREVEYNSFGRHFHLILRKSLGVLARDFRVVAVNADNVERVVDIKPAIYHGYLAGERRSSAVSAYWEDEETLSATIQTPDDVFTIEPAWRHLPQSSNYSMISYRGSDLRMDEDLGKSFCGYARVDVDVNYTRDVGHEEDAMRHHSPGTRGRRAASPCATSTPQPVCNLMLVADYRYFRAMGAANLQRTTSYLISQIDNINTIYKNTHFGACGSGFGFEIQEIKIHEEWSPRGEYGHFNEDKDDWETGPLLETFSRDPAYQRFCLVHLFTHIAFDNGVLGLAYIAGPRSYSVGGICSSHYFKDGFRLYLNTGWSSSLSRGNRKLVSQEATLVTAHEFGHNWGSEHDPDSSECSPSSSSGGKFLMYMYSVSGMETNNKWFSPCSRRSVGVVLKSKADGCFKQSVGGFCGNMRVDGDEECDAGSGGDACCDSNCHLKPGAKCSDANDVCCQRCQLASSNVVCEIAQTSVCLSETKCSGRSKDCPRPDALPDRTPCLQKGHCLGGRCVSLCEYNHRQSCICDKVEDSCKWCCSTGTNTSCSPYANNLLPEGMPCLQGYCNAVGECVKRIQHSIPRLWNVIEDFTVSSFVMIMRANIVGTVIVLSLILWIPICVIIYCIDKNAQKEIKDNIALRSGRVRSDDSGIPLRQGTSRV